MAPHMLRGPSYAADSSLQEEWFSIQENSWLRVYQAILLQPVVVSYKHGMLPFIGHLCTDA